MGNSWARTAFSLLAGGLTARAENTGHVCRLTPNDPGLDTSFNRSGAALPTVLTERRSRAARQRSDFFWREAVLARPVVIVRSAQKVQILDRSVLRWSRRRSGENLP